MSLDPLFVGKLLFLTGAGFVAGFYGVSVGSGSLLTIPALLFTGMPLSLVIATNRFAVVWGELAGVIGFQKHITFDRRFALLCGLIGSMGAFAGSRIVLVLDENILNLVVGLFLLLIVGLLFSHKKWGEGSVTLPLSRKILMLCAMPFIGLYAGFFGASHGTFSLMILTGCGLGFFQSAATTRVIGAMVAVTVALSFMQAGVIQWPQGIALGIGFTCGGLMGVRFSVRRGFNFFRWLLILAALASAAKLLWQVL